MLLSNSYLVACRRQEGYSGDVTAPTFKKHVKSTQNIVGKHFQTLRQLLEPHITSSICHFSKLVLINEQKLNSKHTLHEKCLYSEFFWSVYPVFWQNTEKCNLSLSIQSECGKIWIRKTPNTDTFHAVTRNITTTKMRVQMGYLRHFSGGFHKS